MDAADLMLEDSLFNDSLEREQALKAAFTEPCGEEDRSEKTNLNDSLDLEDTQLPLEEDAMVPCAKEIGFNPSEETNFSSQSLYGGCSKTRKSLGCGGRDDTGSSQEVEGFQQTHHAQGENDEPLPDHSSSGQNVDSHGSKADIEHSPSTRNSSTVCSLTQPEKVVPQFGQKKKPSFIPPTSNCSHSTKSHKAVPSPDGKSKPGPVAEGNSKSKQVSEKKGGNKEDKVGGKNQCVPQSTDTDKAPPMVKYTPPVPKSPSKKENNKKIGDGDLKRKSDSKSQNLHKEKKSKQRLSEAEMEERRAQLAQKRMEREEEKEKKKSEKERKKREAEERKAEKEKQKKERQMECEKRKAEREQRRQEKKTHKRNKKEKGEKVNTGASSDSSKVDEDNVMSLKEQGSLLGERSAELPHVDSDIMHSPQSELHEEEPADVVSTASTQKIKEKEDSPLNCGSNTQIRRERGVISECGVTSLEDDSSLPEGSNEPSEGGRDDSMQMEADTTLNAVTHVEGDAAATQSCDEPEKTEPPQVSAGLVNDIPAGMTEEQGSTDEETELSSAQNTAEQTISENQPRNQAMKVVFETPKVARRDATEKKSSKEEVRRKKTKTPEDCQAEGKKVKSCQVPHVPMKSRKTLMKKKSSQDKNEEKETKNKPKKRKAKLLGEQDDTAEPKQKRSKPTNYSGPVWVQCDIPQCQKWRQIKDCTDPLSLPESWNCTLNPDPKYNMCSAPEETCSDVGDSQEYVESPFIPGSLVWAKMDGYPWWPAMVEEDPNEETYYEMGSSNIPVRIHVVFFDTPVCRGWVSHSHIQPYTEGCGVNANSGMAVSQKHRRGLKEAQKQAQRAANMLISERLVECSFAKRYRKMSSKKRKTGSDEEQSGDHTFSIRMTVSGSSNRNRKSARLSRENFPDEPEDISQRSTEAS